MKFSDCFDGEPAEYGLTEEAGQLLVDFRGKVEASEFELEPTQLPIGAPRMKTNMVVVSFKSQRRRWQLWATGQPALHLTFQWIMSNMREANHDALLVEYEHTPAVFNGAWEIVQEVESGN